MINTAHFSNNRVDRSVPESSEFKGFKHILDEINQQDEEIIMKQLSNSPIYNKSIFDQSLHHNATRNHGINNSAQKNFFESISSFDQNYFISPTPLPKLDTTTYIKLETRDMELIIAAINNNNDPLRQMFGCQSLRKLLSSGNENLASQVLQAYPGLMRRLIQLLQMKQQEEVYFEICWCLVNLTTVKFSPNQINELIQFGLFESLLAMVSDEEGSLTRSELALNAINNSIIGQNCEVVRELLDTAHILGQNQLSLIQKVLGVQKIIENSQWRDEFQSIVLQISVFAQQMISNYEILQKQEFRAIVVITVNLILTTKMHKEILDSALLALRLACQKNEFSCNIIQKHSRKFELAQKLTSFLTLFEQPQISFNSLLIIGELASSEYFQEKIIVLEGQIYEKFEFMLRHCQQNLNVQHRYHIQWIMGNLIADSIECQIILIKNYQDLVILMLREGISFMNSKVTKEGFIFLNNLLDIKNIKKYILNNEMLVIEILKCLDFSLKIREKYTQLEAIKALQRLCSINNQLLRQIILSQQNCSILSTLQHLQYTPTQFVYDEVLYLIKTFLYDLQRLDLFENQDTDMEICTPEQSSTSPTKQSLSQQFKLLVIDEV